MKRQIDTTWRKIRLGDIAEVQTGPFGSQLHMQDYVSDGTPMITVEHLINDRVAHTIDTPRVSKEDKKRLSRYTLREGDLVFSRVGSVDRIGHITENEDGWMFSGRLLRVRPDKEKVDARYLYYFLTREKTKAYIRNIAVGATMPSLNTDLLSDVPVMLPSLNIQKEIARILTPLDEKIELNDKISHTLETMAEAIFKEWFIQNKSDNWEAGKFTDFIDILSGGTPSTHNPSYWEGEIPFFTPKDVGDKFYCLNTENKITQDGLKHCNSPLYPKNIVFVTARGTVGKIAMAGVPMAMNQSCYALHGKEYLSDRFVFLLTKNIVTDLQKQATGGVFDTITISTFEHLKMFKPPRLIIEKFSKFIDPIFEQMLNLAHENEWFTTSRDELSLKLITGKIKI